MAKWIILAGGLLMLIGVLMHYAPWLFSWFGRLPGDINIQSENSRVFIPITSMLVLSVVLSIGFNLVRKFF